MTKFSHLAIVALFASFAAHATDPVATPATAAPQKNATAPQKITTVAAPQKAAPAAAPQNTAAMSQQDKMRFCSKEATGKKGAERKAFMKTCLSKKA